MKSHQHVLRNVRRIVPTVLMGWSMLYTPASADVLYTGDTAFAVENRVQIQQPADRVWQTLVQQIDQWWPKDHSWWGGTFSIEAHAGAATGRVTPDTQHRRVTWARSV